jgi:hypothetical protein
MVLFPAPWALKKGCGVIYAGMQPDDFIYIRHLQYFFHMAFRTGHAQSSPNLFKLAGGHHDDSNPGAIDVGYAGQIKDDLFVRFSYEAVDCPLQMLALPAHCDPSGYQYHKNIGLDALALNIQHGKPPFADFSFRDNYLWPMLRDGDRDGGLEVNEC